MKTDDITGVLGIGAAAGFATELTVTGPYRSPAQMLEEQQVDGHTSIHDGDTAGSLGLAGAPIEAPTHFSQFDPLAAALWGRDWFERGCISSHFRTMVVEGEQVQASLTTTGPLGGRIEAHKADGTPVLEGTISLGPDHPPTALEVRRAAQGGPGELFILDQLEVGMEWPEAVIAQIPYDEGNGPGYPFHHAVLIQVAEAHPILSPAYTFGGATEEALAAEWQAKYTESE